VGRRAPLKNQRGVLALMERFRIAEAFFQRLGLMTL